MDDKAANVISLFASSSTLICCALPAVFVIMGAGASFASLVTALPFLITISHYKIYISVITLIILVIAGLLIEKSPTEVVIEVNGIGYSINISLNTFSKLGNNENIKLFTHQIIKEDSHSLYGFFEKSERFLFVKLISVSGVGASTARTMLSSLSPYELISAFCIGVV